jgi:hypothetical protein
LTELWLKIHNRINREVLRIKLQYLYQRGVLLEINKHSFVRVELHLLLMWSSYYLAVVALSACHVLKRLSFAQIAVQWLKIVNPLSNRRERCRNIFMMK